MGCTQYRESCLFLTRRRAAFPFVWYSWNICSLLAFFVSCFVKTSWLYDFESLISSPESDIVQERDAIASDHAKFRRDVAEVDHLERRPQRAVQLEIIKSILVKWFYESLCNESRLMIPTNVIHFFDTLPKDVTATEYWHIHSEEKWARWEIEVSPAARGLRSMWISHRSPIECSRASASTRERTSPRRYPRGFPRLKVRICLFAILSHQSSEIRCPLGIWGFRSR